MSVKERIIIDTDPGVDDSMALFFALAHENLVIEGITIVMGNNNNTDLLARNACIVLDLCPGSPCIPIYKGGNKPLEGEYFGFSGIECHGKNGIGNIEMADPKNLHLIQHDVPAEQFIIDICTKYPQEISIVALGPHTNIAKALILQPDLKNKIKRIFSMGGAFLVKGNVSPVAEANIHNDPVAAKIVFNSGIDIMLTPLDVTSQVHMDPPFMKHLQQIGDVGQFLFNISQHYIEQIVAWGSDINTLPIHDASAIMAIVHPTVFSDVVKVCVDVETKGELTKGQTVADWEKWWKRNPQTTIFMKVDQIQYKTYLLEQLRKLVQRGK